MTTTDQEDARKPTHTKWVTHRAHMPYNWIRFASVQGANGVLGLSAGESRALRKLHDGESLQRRYRIDEVGLRNLPRY